MNEKSAKYVSDLLHLASTHEALVQHLYEAFAEKMPEKRDFWLAIASVEAKHVRIMDTLEEHSKQSLLRMRPESQLTINDVQNAVNHLQLYLDEVRSKGISPRRAGIVAKEIEEGILESNFDKQFLVEDENAEALLRSLCEDTRAHSQAMDSLVSRHDEFSQLVHAQIISQVQVELARSLAQTEGVAVDAILRKRFGVSRSAILKSFSSYYHVSSYEYDESADLPDNVRRSVSERYADMKNRMYVPFQLKDKCLVVVMANPGNMPLRDEIILSYSTFDLKFLVGLPDDIISLIDNLAGASAQPASAAALLDQLNQENQIEETGGTEAELLADKDSALVKLVNYIIEEAYQKGASDIHIEPIPKEDTLIRIRVDGILLSLMAAPARYSRAMLSRLKIMAGLDISERRKPQSGKIHFRRWGRFDVELRVETYPTADNQEDAAIRILASGKPLALDQMGLSPLNLMVFKGLVSQPYGLILCVGPTGSGKTTTLHSALGYINKPELKILTIEDPIEITQRGLRQMQVNSKAEVTFATALRSFLRSDPDVIMVGEMRDFEAARAAVEASLTGHLVFSTLHTNNAPETVTRLLDMGLDPFAFADSLLGILAQRLARRLCPDCKQDDASFASARKLLETEYGLPDEFNALLAPDPDFHPAQPIGCSKCSGTGYRGRLALHELLAIDDPLRQMIVRKAPASELRTYGLANGMRTLRQDGIVKVLRGQTSIAEIRSICAR